MSNCQHHVCGAHCLKSNVSQSLDELEFERGIWSAAQYGDIERIEKLLKQDWNVDKRDSAGYTALHYASRNGHLNVCALLLSNGANINASTKAGEATALHRACFAGKADVVKLLLDKKANAKVKDVDGKSALHRAAESGNREICQILLQTFSELKNEKDNKGKTPVDYTCDENILKLFSEMCI